MSPDPARRRAWESTEEHLVRMREEGRSLCPICARFILVTDSTGRLRVHRRFDDESWTMVPCPASRRLQPLRPMAAV